MRLDVGCGDRPSGDVNCDLDVGKSPHRGGNRSLNPKLVPNFVICSCNNLPFKDGSFTELFCSHVLEHKGVKPFQAIAEFKRVTHGDITIVVPHRFSREKWFPYRQFAMHDKYFSLDSMNKLLIRAGFSNPHDALQVKWKCFPNELLCLVRLPWEIRVCIHNG